ncbi:MULTISPECIES: lasso peptide biosynthesis PqqD family chaperone [Actinosynnema]|uniref:lasso peptide biosynthesis PqqD family chaperone n=1 Tax=Actinosynnema TaxID=40566 RepID=UPI0020A3E498|nr:lasso peptide biosynthesis PqqD family chaperone [Actinosynnema pretiosum]MCP2097692.1 Coenzyme PQQ synthesis protein D (PqqD) [Actinosynnema pretiosum]
MTFALVPHVTVTTTPHGLVLLDGRTGRYWMVNGTGALVLRHLLDGGTPDTAAADLGARFPDAADAVRADVDDLVSALRDAGVTAG